MTRLILASTSPSRKTLLERLKIPFETANPNVDETPLVNEKAPDLVLRLAQQKASAVANRYPNSLIIGADQVGIFNDTILCKPLTQENAIAQLTLVSGKSVQFFTGLCLLDTRTQTNHTSVAAFDVVFRSLTLNMIKHYLAKEDALNCAGSCTIEGLGIALIEKLQGDDYTALIGLPLIQLVSMLEKANFPIL